MFVQTDTGNLRRNQQHLTVVPDRTQLSEQLTSTPTTTTSSTPRSPGLELLLLQDLLPDLERGMWGHGSARDYQ